MPKPATVEERQLTAALDLIGATGAAESKSGIAMRRNPPWSTSPRPGGAVAGNAPPRQTSSRPCSGYAIRSSTAGTARTATARPGLAPTSTRCRSSRNLLVSVGPRAVRIPARLRGVGAMTPTCYHGAASATAVTGLSPTISRPAGVTTCRTSNGIRAACPGAMRDPAPPTRPVAAHRRARPRRGVPAVRRDRLRRMARRPRRRRRGSRALRSRAASRRRPRADRQLLLRRRIPHLLTRRSSAITSPAGAITGRSPAPRCCAG